MPNPEAERWYETLLEVKIAAGNVAKADKDDWEPENERLRRAEAAHAEATRALMDGLYRNRYVAGSDLDYKRLTFDPESAVGKALERLLLAHGQFRFDDIPDARHALAKALEDAIDSLVPCSPARQTTEHGHRITETCPKYERIRRAFGIIETDE